MQPDQDAFQTLLFTMQLLCMPVPLKEVIQGGNIARQEVRIQSLGELELLPERLLKTFYYSLAKI
jgi:hypothetical protein